LPGQTQRGGVAQRNGRRGGHGGWAVNKRTATTPNGSSPPGQMMLYQLCAHHAGVDNNSSQVHSHHDVGEYFAGCVRVALYVETLVGTVEPVFRRRRTSKPGWINAFWICLWQPWKVEKSGQLVGASWKLPLVEQRRPDSLPQRRNGLADLRVDAAMGHQIGLGCAREQVRGEFAQRVIRV